MDDGRNDAADPGMAHWPSLPKSLRRNHSISTSQLPFSGAQAPPSQIWQSRASFPSIWSDAPWSVDQHSDVASQQSIDHGSDMPRKYSLCSDYDPHTRAQLRTSPNPDVSWHSHHMRRLWGANTPRHSAPQTFLEETIAKLGTSARSSTSAYDTSAMRPVGSLPAAALNKEEATSKPHRRFSVSGQKPVIMHQTRSLGAYRVTDWTHSSVSQDPSHRPVAPKESAIDPSHMLSHLNLQEGPSSYTMWSSRPEDENLAPESLSTPHKESTVETAASVSPYGASEQTSKAPVVYMPAAPIPPGLPTWPPSPGYAAPYMQPPGVLTLPPPQRAFVIKSFTDVDVQRSMDHGVWTSTEKGNQRLDRAWKQSHTLGPIYLFFSVNGSGRFCGLAQMTSGLDYNQSSDIWADGSRWKGLFHVHWLLIKDVPNVQFRHICLYSTYFPFTPDTADLRPMTKSRDTQELLPEAALAALQIFIGYTSPD
ncbi:hypothetical protein MNAN1_002716 [Malassezia nana]|uniref:YTH domain-containing protein n=1 Tax=Malassezia nana TaxID=180528 RepID=A0AAF0J326_9BASI|nr:hypothetical protein MNAN1_002716 [Malassezia nana]